MKDLRKQTHKKMAHGSGHPIATCFGILGWLFHGILSVITAGLIIMAIVGLLIYAKVKPELDQCREIAYDKLAQMERSDFSMLSDTVVYDKAGKQIGLINAGHYQYVDISKISMNLQNGYIAQEDRRFKSHGGVDWIATFRAGLALVKHGGDVTQGGSTITQQVVKEHLPHPGTVASPGRSWRSCWRRRSRKSTPKLTSWSFTATPISTATSAMAWKLPACYYFGKDASDLASGRSG